MKNKIISSFFIAALSLIVPDFLPAQSNTATPSTSGYVSLKDIEIYYEIYGEGQPLLLLHGSFMPIPFNWAEMIPELSKNRKVIAVEMDGHGRTPLTNRDMNYQLYAKDVAETLYQLGIKKADIMGYSFGGTVALQLLVDYPELFNRAVIISTTYKSDGWLPEVTSNLKKMKKDFLDHTPIKSFYASVAPDTANWYPSIEKHLTFESQSFDIGKTNMQKIKSPVLYIMGDNDGVTNTHKHELMELSGNGLSGDIQGLPQSQMLILPGRTHVGLMMETEILLSHIFPFLDGKTVDAFLLLMQQLKKSE